jgi:hypothetical protein
MDSLRLVPGESAPPLEPCSRCHASGQRWDRIAGQTFCPDCEESLVRGESEPLITPTEKRRCCVCDYPATVCYQTLPLDGDTLLALDLCPEHFRALLGRRIEPYAFFQLRRRLLNLGLSVEQVFLLHEAFYDREGQALQPVPEVEY